MRKKANFSIVDEKTVTDAITDHYTSVWGESLGPSDISTKPNINLDNYESVDTGTGGGSNTWNPDVKELIPDEEEAPQVTESKNVLQTWLLNHLGVDMPVWGIYTLIVLIVLIIFKKK